MEVQLWAKSKYFLFNLALTPSRLCRFSWIVKESEKSHHISSPNVLCTLVLIKKTLKTKILLQMRLKIWLWNTWVTSEEVLIKYMKSVIIMSVYSWCTMHTHTKIAWCICILTINTDNFLTEVFFKSFYTSIDLDKHWPRQGLLNFYQEMICQHNPFYICMYESIL